MHVFSELSLLIAVAAAVAMLMKALRQPLIIGYILTGILVGPAVLGFVQSPEVIDSMGSFGIALLLFIVGLNLNPKEIKEVGRVSLLVGLGQVLFTSSIGFFIAKLLGFTPITAFYIAVALTFSSTIIILKLLTDKKEQNKLYGRISIGVLLIQDIIAAFALLIGSAVGTGGLSYESLIELTVKGTVLFTAVGLAASLVVKRMNGFLSRSQELLFLFALAWGFGIATLSHELGFSLEVGALFAGVALASMSFAQEIAARLRPLRDFFIVVFFIALGAELNIAGIGSLAWEAVVLSAFVLIGNPIIVMIITGLLGYTKRTSFKTGLTVAQISEFSIIFILLGFRHGQVSDEAVALVTVVGIATIAISSYMITYSDELYTLFERHLSLFERRKVKKEPAAHRNYDGVLFGYHKGGHDFVKLLKKVAKKYVVIDYDPDAIDMMERRNIPYIYGDAGDITLLEEIGVDNVKIAASVVNDFETNLSLLSYLENNNPKAVFICSADTYEEAAELYGLGASYVMLPHYIGTEKISNFISRSGLKKTEFKKFRDKQLQNIRSQFEPGEEVA